jgi:hypothetical protein
MNAETIERRVSYWVESRVESGWFAQQARHILLGEWRTTMRHFHAHRPPATGVVVALMREAWGDPWASVCRAQPGGWHVVFGNVSPSPSATTTGASEIEAALNALEAAP